MAMFSKYVLMMSICFFIFACKKAEPQQTTTPIVSESVINTMSNESERASGTTIATRFSLPKGYVRKEHDKKSFQYFLRHFPLFPSGRAVHYFNGGAKLNQGHHAAVLQIDVGDKDLQQCADAIMRLRAEYLYKEKEFEKIHFNFVSGFNMRFDKWMDGNRIRVNGNKVSWYETNQIGAGRESFMAYLQKVFMYAGTASLVHELNPKEIADIEIGDVFIQGGSPGHAVLVVDVAEHKSTDDKIFLLAQSYMPAQDIHVLKNKSNKMISPWYAVNEIEEKLHTPEWTFKRSDLRSFE